MTKKLKTIPDAGRIALVSYSMWGLYAAFIFTNASDAIFYYFGVDTSPSVWSVLLNVAIIAAIVGRVIMQTPEGAWRRRALIAVGVAVLALWAIPAIAMETWSEDKLAIVPVEPEPVPPGQPSAGPTWLQTAEVLTPLVAKWEGKRNTAYLDSVGVPTICYGHTRTVTRSHVAAGLRWTDTRCEEQLRDE